VVREEAGEKGKGSAHRWKNGKGTIKGNEDRGVEYLRQYCPKRRNNEVGKR